MISNSRRAGARRRSTRCGPALRLLADVDIFFLAELLFASSGRTMELGRSGRSMIGSPAARYGVIDNDRQFLQHLRGALGFARAGLRQAPL